MILRTIGTRVALFAALWWVLTSGARDAWGVGLVAIVLAVAVSLRLRVPSAPRLSIARLLPFLAFFLRSR